MSKKIVHKLTKESRSMIALNYTKDKMSADMNEFNNAMNTMADTAVNIIYDVYGKETVLKLKEQMKKLNIRSHHKNGLICDHYERRNSSSVSLNCPVYRHNDIQLTLDPYRGEYIWFKNMADQKDELSYKNIKDMSYRKEAYELNEQCKQLNEKASKLFNECYELLKSVRTAENLMLQWSEAKKYLPDNLEVENPKKLSLSQRFSMLK